MVGPKEVINLRVGAYLIIYKGSVCSDHWGTFVNLSGHKPPIRTA